LQYEILFDAAVKNRLFNKLPPNFACRKPVCEKHLPVLVTNCEAHELNFPEVENFFQAEKFPPDSAAKQAEKTELLTRNGV